jgi:hypothetical protein
MSGSVRDIDFILNSIQRRSCIGRTRVIAIVVYAAGGKQKNPDSSLHAITGAILRQCRNGKCVIYCSCPHISKEDIVLRFLIRPAKIAVPILKTERHNDRILLKNTLPHSILGKTDKFNFGLNGIIGGIQTLPTY